VWFNVEHYHNTHSTQYRCTHYTLLSTAWCFQSVCSSVTPWCVILFSTNSSPLVHPPVHIPPAPHWSRHPHPPQGLSRKMWTVSYTTYSNILVIRYKVLLTSWYIPLGSADSKCTVFRICNEKTLQYDTVVTQYSMAFLEFTLVVTPKTETYMLQTERPEFDFR
jgi:hypothetical protein